MLLWCAPCLHTWKQMAEWQQCGRFFFLSGNQSVQRCWAPGEPTRHVARCSLSWGRDGESSDLALTFPGHQRGMGEEEETFSAKWKGEKGRGDHPSKADLKLKHWRALQSSLQYAKHGFCINTQHFRGRHRDKDEVISNNKRENERKMEG